VLVCLADGRAKDCGTHWAGGPDLAVEIVSPGEDPRQKLAFYAAIGTRELLVVDRKPWGIELYQLVGTQLILRGRSDVANPAVLASRVLPITFQLVDGLPRPTIRVTHTATGQVWVA
jgi:Uma2 family endonuclease